MAKLKRNGGTVPEKPKALRQDEWKDHLHEFLHDWGVLAALVVLVGGPLGLHALGWVGGVAAGYFLGLVAMIGAGLGFAQVIRSHEFPPWVARASIVAGLVVVIGAVVPFTLSVYPGSPEAQAVVTKDAGDIAISDIGAGTHVVQVFAKSFSAAETRQGEGGYRLAMGGRSIEGKFSDVMRTTRGRRGMSGQVEDKHLTETHVVSFDQAPATIKATRLDSIIGPELLVSVYPVLLPPWLSYVLLSAVLVFAIFLDGRFQDQTARLRFAPWVGAILGILVLFNAGYEPAKMPGNAIWSAVIGGLLGFTLGWVLSLVGRVVVGRIRTRM